MKKLTVFLLIMLTFPTIIKNQAAPVYKAEVRKIIDDVFSKEKLIAYMIEIGIKHPEIVLAQAKLESGRFKSRIFRENHNLFGMKLPKIRKTLATGKNRGYATFKDWKSSVNDYKLWQDRMIKKGKTKAEYYTYLQKNYAENEQYVIILKKIVYKT
jgi:flagellum-specific peptidoglycan hydrolase FlgJ